tara:strand:+ start:9271 stop:9921 length:651 start_codon:yes stop_codon:yes gene_type:complete
VSYKFKSKINKINFEEWYKTIKKKKVKFHHIKKIGEINRDKNEFATSLLDTKITFKNKIISRAIHLEGDSVVVIPLIKLNKKIKTIMVKQFRVPIGKYNLEFVSGGVSNNRFKTTAMNEVKEELNIDIKIKDLIELHKGKIFLMPGNNFARAKFFAFVYKANNIDMNRFKSLKTGNNKNGEYLKTVVKDFKEIKLLRTASVIIALKLLQDKKLIKI